MNKFYKINKLGIVYDCYVVAETNYDGVNYAIYTDFINDKNGDIRLMAARIINGNFVDISFEESNRIVEEFEKEKEKFLKEVRSW